MVDAAPIGGYSTHEVKCRWYDNTYLPLLSADVVYPVCVCMFRFDFVD